MAFLDKNDKSFWSSFAVFVLVLTLAFTINCVLDIAGFESTYLESIINQYTIQGEAAKNKIETSLNLGKKLHLLKDQYDDIFYTLLKQDSGVFHFYVVNADNNVIYTTRQGSYRTDVPFEIEHRRDLLSQEERPPVNTVKFLDSYYICIPLFSEGRFFQGTIMAEFSQDDISSYIYKVSFRIFRFALILIIFSLCVYLFLSWRFIDKPKAKSIILVLVLLGSQTIFTIHNNRLYNTIISNVFNKNMSVLAKSIADELRTPLDYGIKVDNLGDANLYLAKRIEGTPQCADAYITDINLRILYEAHSGERQKSTYENNNRLSHQDGDLTFIQLVSNFGTGYLMLRINRPLINSILRDIVMDSITIIIVALIFAFILRDFFAFMDTRKLIIKNRSVLQTSDFEKHGLRLIKISTFMFMFAAFETLSFIPILIQSIYRSNPINLFGLSQETMISLPMGSYMLGILLSMFATIFYLKKINIWKRHILMAAVFVIGSIATMCTRTFLLFTIARFITGFGFGGVLLNLASIVIYYTTVKTRGVGFGTNSAALGAASICSIAVGGIVVNKFGYNAGILISVVFAVLFLVFSLLCLTSEKRKRIIQEENFSFSNFVQILRSKQIIVYLLCINIPFQLIYYGLFQFILPTYMNDTLGLSYGNIGRILSISCIISLSAAFISRLTEYAKNDKLLLAIGAFFVGITLIAFGYYPAGGLVLFIAVMIGMGINNIFIDTIEEVYVSNLNVKGYSEESIIQGYKVSEKIITVFIPTITGLIITFTGFNISMIIIGLLCVIGGAAFIALGYNGRWKKEK